MCIECHAFLSAPRFWRYIARLYFTLCSRICVYYLTIASRSTGLLRNSGDRDVYVFDAIANKFPPIHKFCDGLMPEGVRREDDGTGNGLKSHRANDTLHSDAERRSAAKRVAQDDLRSVTKKDKKSEEMEKRIDHVLNKTLSRFSSLFDKEHVKDDEEEKKAKWDAELAKLQSESAKLDLLKKSLRAEMELRHAYIEQYEELEKKIIAQRGRPDGGNPVFIALLETELADIATALGKRCV